MYNSSVMNNHLLKALIFINVCLFTVDDISSQSATTVQFIAGYSHPLPDLKGNFGEFNYQWTGNGNPDTNTFFMKRGINYGLIVKTPVKYKSNLLLNVSLIFNVFNNSIAYNDTSGTNDYDLTQRILGLSLGLEYIFYSKRNRINPFVGLNLSSNFFAGNLKINGGQTEYTMNPAVRLGINAGAGVNYSMGYNLGVVIGAKYGFANIIGKNYKKDIGFKYNLNDGEHISESGVKYPNKNITYLQFYGGLSYYFSR